MNKELQAAYEQKEKERIAKERETLRDMIALSVLSSLIQVRTDTQSRESICLSAYDYAEKMLEVRDKLG